MCWRLDVQSSALVMVELAGKHATEVDERQFVEAGDQKDLRPQPLVERPDEVLVAPVGPPGVGLP